MARMIPPQISPNCKSPGEKILFEKFKNDPLTVDWIVLHSLDIAKHPERLSGEIDFIVIVPDEGVLCLEVKAGNVKRRDGYWLYGSPPYQDKSTVGPFKQASDGMHAVRKFLSRSDITCNKLMFFSGVLFTYIDFDEQSPEWHIWQYADRSRLSRTPISEVCSKILRCAHEHVRSTPSAAWYDPKASRPDKEHSLKIANFLRGNFEGFYPFRTAAEETEKMIMQFTEEQYSALDTLDENDRIVFKGPAGTGKTFLALEAARRSVLSGKRTLLLCFNKLLGSWINHQTESFGVISQVSFKSGNLHKYLKDLAGTIVIPENASDFWTRQLPAIVTDKILNDEIQAPLFDMLIIDEAQDLIKDEYLDVLDLLLKGGLSGGHWAMFGDFERQAIYSLQMNFNQDADLISMIKQRAPFHFHFPLRINCRNTQKISVGLEVACKLEPRYSRVLHVESGTDIEIEFYSRSDDQQQKLLKHLTELRSVFNNEEIVVLSPRENSASCAENLTKNLPKAGLYPLSNQWQKKSFVGYSTIHAFKGLEASAVIITDIEELEGAYAEALLYIGMSRARQRLVLIMDDRCRKTYLDINMQGMKLILGGQCV